MSLFCSTGRALEIPCRLCVAHPHIVQFRELFLTDSHLAIVMEFAAGGDMFDYVIKNKGSGGAPACRLQPRLLRELILASQKRWMPHAGDT